MWLPRNSKKTKRIEKLQHQKRNFFFIKSRTELKKLIRNSKKQHCSEKLGEVLKNPLTFYKQLDKIKGRAEKQRLLLKNGGKDVTEPTDVE